MTDTKTTMARALDLISRSFAGDHPAARAIVNRWIDDRLASIRRPDTWAWRPCPGQR